jgi:hypothetical protein
MVDRKLFQLWIVLLTIVKAIERLRIVAGTDAGSADAQRHLVRCEEFMHQSRPVIGRKLVQHIAGRIGEGRAKAEHLLPRLGGVQYDRVGGNRIDCGLPHQRLRRYMPSITEGAPHLHWAANCWAVGAPGRYSL